MPTSPTPTTLPNSNGPGRTIGRSTSLIRLDFSIAVPFAAWIMSISSTRYSTSDTMTAAATRSLSSAATSCSLGGGAERMSAMAAASSPEALSLAVSAVTASA